MTEQDHKGRYFLWGDRTEETDKAIQVLKETGIPFDLALNHTVSTCPILEGERQRYRGVHEIKKFCREYSTIKIS